MTGPGTGRVDPFGLTPDTGSYVPRAATERALAELLATAQRGPQPVALLGPAGIGKTLLLHLLAERAGPGLRSVYLPNPRLEPEELCTWVARGLGASAREDPVPLLRAWLAHLREQEEGCLLLVDDADALPVATARWLGGLVASAREGLRLVLAALDGPAAERVLRSIGGLRVVRLDVPMSPQETEEYVEWRLLRAGVPDAIRARFDAAALAELHRASRGNPRRLHLAVEALARSGEAHILEDELAQLASSAKAPVLPAELRGARAAPGRDAPTSQAKPPVLPAELRGARAAPGRDAPTSQAKPPVLPAELRGARAAPGRDAPTSQAKAPVPPAAAPAATPPQATARTPAAPSPTAPQATARTPAAPSPTAPPEGGRTPAPDAAGAARPGLDRPPRPPQVRRPLISAAAATLCVAVVWMILGAPERDRSAPTDRPARPAPADPVRRTHPVAPNAPVAAPVPARPTPSGTLPVNVNASPWAVIEVDGIELGETPLAAVPLRPGPHAFRARLPDGRIVERTVEIGQGNRHVVFE